MHQYSLKDFGILGRIRLQQRTEVFQFSALLSIFRHTRAGTGILLGSRLRLNNQ